MSCNQLNGTLTGSANATFASASLEAEFYNNIGDKINTVPVSLTISTPHQLQGTLTASLYASYNKFLGYYYTQSYHMTLLQGSLNNPVPLQLCIFEPTPPS